MIIPGNVHQKIPYQRRVCPDEDLKTRPCGVILHDNERQIEPAGIASCKGRSLSDKPKVSG
jgi:hypothetical protein